MATWSKCIDIIEDNNYWMLQKEIERHPGLVSLTDARGWDLLIHSALYDAYECSVVLVQKGSNINRKTEYQETALMCAATNGSFKIAQYLLEQGAHVSNRNLQGESAFDLAMFTRRKKEWFDIFSLYKGELDEHDLALYHKLRLPALFV